MSISITARSFSISTILDQARLVPNPPHHSFSSSNGLESPLAAICGLVSVLVSINVTNN